MLLSKFLPLLVMGGTAVHSGGAIKERIGGVLFAKEKFLAKQHIQTMMTTATLSRVNGGTIDTSSPEKFRAWVRSNVRIAGSRKIDPSIDPWGTPYRGLFAAGNLTVTSAAADKVFGTKDDLVVKENVDDY